MDDREYVYKGTLHTCPYTGEPAIVEMSGSDVDKSQCSHSKECTITPCPLEQRLKQY